MHALGPAVFSPVRDFGVYNVRVTGDSGRAVRPNKMKAELYVSIQEKGGGWALEVIFTNSQAVAPLSLALQ